jgi:hypothetical protein
MQQALYIALALVVFFAPTWLARPGRRTSVFIVNAALGLTGIGWIRALYLAARSWE